MGNIREYSNQDNALSPDEGGAATTARAAALSSASWLRAQAHAIKAAGISDFWGLDA